jgi:hypothetical protein
VNTVSNNSFVIANGSDNPVNVLLDINGYFQ